MISCRTGCPTNTHHNSPAPNISTTANPRCPRYQSPAPGTNADNTVATPADLMRPPHAGHSAGRPGTAAKQCGHRCINPSASASISADAVESAATSITLSSKNLLSARGIPENRCVSPFPSRTSKNPLHVERTPRINAYGNSLTSPRGFSPAEICIKITRSVVNTSARRFT